MAVTFGFYDSVNNDRRYNAIQLSSIFDGIINDGIFANIGTSMMITPGTGLKVIVGRGRAWFNHTWTNNDSELILDIDLPDMVLNRIDTAVIEINSTESVRQNSIKILKGTPGSTPVAPTLTNTSTVHQYPLGDILVEVGATEFIQAKITNRVGTSPCPFITGPLQVLTADSLIAQWHSEWEVITDSQLDEFVAWFNNVKDQLSTDAAGNLQLQINAIPILSKASAAEVSAGTDDEKYITPKALKDGGGGGGATNLAQIRLSLSSTIPKTANDVLAATSVYIHPFNGRKLTLWNGSKWDDYTISAANVSVPSTTLTLFDIFAYPNESSINYETVSWTNQTTRSVDVVFEDGILVKSGDKTRRYIGTGRTTSVSGQCEDSTSKRFLWNYYNRTKRQGITTNSNASWSYNVMSFREYNGGTGQTRAEFIIGIEEDYVNLINTPAAVPYSGKQVMAYLGLDGTDVNARNNANKTGTNYYNLSGQYFATLSFPTNNIKPTIGYHYITQIEYTSSTDVATVNGTGYPGYIMMEA